MKKFFAILALIAVSLTACDKGDKAEETTAATSAIKLSTDFVEFGKKGGEQSVLITIENPTGGKVTAETNVEWLDAVIDFNEKVIITAEANDGEPRDAKVTVKYSSAKDVTITVEQKGSSAGEYDVEFDANRFEGIYFGNSASTTYNYYVIISDIGATINGEPKANGTYYFFDFYSKVAGDSEYPILPNGTYTFDTKNSMGDATFTNEASWYAVMDEKGDYKSSANFASATVTVKDNMFEAIIEMDNGEVHRVLYEGDLNVDSDYITSTFTEDFTFAFEGANVTATNFGDILGFGVQAWYIEAVKDNDLFMFEVFTSSAESPAGIFSKLTGATNERYEDKYVPGYISEKGLMGTWYAKLTNGSIKGDVMAPIADGLIQITVTGNAISINISSSDDAGNKIEGSVSGTYTEKVLEE